MRLIQTDRKLPTDNRTTSQMTGNPENGKA